MYLKTHKFQEDITSTNKIYLSNPVHEFNKYGKKLEDLSVFDLLDKNGIIKIGIKFISEQFKNNDEDTIIKKEDLWSFEKPIKSKNPNWLLSST